MKTHGYMSLKESAWAEGKMKKQQQRAAVGSSSMGFTKCSDNMAGEYPCKNVNLLSVVSLADLGCGDLYGSDMWGWTDDEGNEYAITSCESGITFVDITNGKRPVVMGRLLANAPGTSYWWDIKVYQNHAFIGSELNDHGLSIFDLTQLTPFITAFRQSQGYSAHMNRDIAQNGHTKLNIPFQPTARYDGFSRSHNIVINEASGFLYVVGSNTCMGGLHILDIQNPTSPQFVGCYDEDGYTHDAQCVIYDGPDKRFTGREICFNYNEDTLTIVDVTDKEDMRMLARKGYKGAQYTHQGWLAEGMAYLMLDDELDELNIAKQHGKARTHIFDVSNLRRPKRIGSHMGKEVGIDHNQYIHRGLSFQSNYCAGLRVVTTDQLHVGKAKEVAYFDVSPGCDIADWYGAWSSYPFYTSDTVAVGSIENGLFLLRPKSKLYRTPAISA